MHHILLSVTLFSMLLQANGIRLSGNDLKNICVQAKRFVASGYSPNDAVEKISSRIEKKYQEKFLRSGESSFAMSPNDELMLRATIGAFIGETERLADDPYQYGASKLFVKDDFKQKNYNYLLTSRTAALGMGTSSVPGDGIFLINSANRIKNARAKSFYLDGEDDTVAEDALGRYVNEAFQKDKGSYPIRHIPGAPGHVGESKVDETAPTIPMAPPIHVNPNTNNVNVNVNDPAECYAIHYPDQIETEDQTKWTSFIENLVSQMTGRHLTGR